MTERIAPVTRAARHAAIAEALASTEIGSQRELRDILVARGFDVTQATLSRDLTELRATKVRSSGGGQVYALPSFEPGAPHALAASEQLARWVSEVLLTAAVAFHQVVLRTPPGAAMLLASALDRAQIEGVLGTLAGDDTILLITDSPERAQNLSQQLLDLADGN